jgi:hypothetical protein
MGKTEVAAFGVRRDKARFPDPMGRQARFR